MKAYNQKIIETPTYLEIYDYEAIITPKQKTGNIETNPKRKKGINGFMKKKIRLLIKEKTTMNYPLKGQYDSLKRKQKYYQNMRFEIARLVDMNFDNQTKFLTLTFRKHSRHCPCE